MPQNYRVKRGHYGAYPPGSILPEFFIRAGNDPDELVERGVLETTADPVNVKIVVPESKKADAQAFTAVAELNEAREKLEAAERENEHLAAHAHMLERHKKDLEKAIARYIEENGDLRRAAEEHQAKIAELEKEVDALLAKDVGLLTSTPVVEDTRRELESA